MPSTASLIQVHQWRWGQCRPLLKVVRGTGFAYTTALFCPFLNTKTVVLPWVDNRCGFIFPAPLAARSGRVARQGKSAGVCWDELSTYCKQRNHNAHSLPGSFLLILGCWVARSRGSEHERWTTLALWATEETGGVWPLDETANPADLSQAHRDSNLLHIREDPTLFSKQGMNGLSCLSYFWSGSFLFASPKKWEFRDGEIEASQSQHSRREFFRTPG